MFICCICHGPDKISAYKVLPSCWWSSKPLWNQDGKDRTSLSNIEWKVSEVWYFPRKPKHWWVNVSMVPYFGRHSCKQFIRGKSIRFGYKIWMLASNTVLPYCLAIYQSKENGGDSDKPLGYRVVTSSLSPCANPSDHHVFIDNFFSSYQLMKNLS